ncbi:MAG: hypothetical protein KAQ62_07945, partial [Cyclobacteriaceae bacterium]|nr:hypothetical protein [Cyclobacteriaceae bacterium]
MLKKIAWGAFILFILMILFIAFSIAPINYTPLDQIAAVNRTFEGLEDTQLDSEKGNSTLKAGWATTNITPKSPINMAGYGPRGPYHAVFDSLNSRAMVIDNGAKEIVIISLDLLMFPRLVKQGVYNALHGH